MFHLKRTLLGPLSKHRTSSYLYSELQLGCRCIVQGWWNSRGVSQSARSGKEDKDPPPDTTLYKEEKDPPPPDETPKFVDTKDEPYRQHQHDNPFQRTFRIMANDITQFFGIPSKRTQQNEGQPSGGAKRGVVPTRVWPSDCDVLIVGGGIMGSSIAYHLQERALDGLKVVVVEEDSTVSSTR